MYRYSMPPVFLSAEQHWAYSSLYELHLQMLLAPELSIDSTLLIHTHLLLAQVNLAASPSVASLSGVSIPVGSLKPEALARGPQKLHCHLSQQLDLTRSMRGLSGRSYLFAIFFFAPSFGPRDVIGIGRAPALMKSNPEYDYSGRSGVIIAAIETGTGELLE